MEGGKRLGLVLLAAILSSSDALGSMCAGDCDGDNTVAVDELILQVRIALGEDELDTCSAADENSSGVVEVNEIVGAVQRALTGCPRATDTPVQTCGPGLCCENSDCLPTFPVCVRGICRPLSGPGDRCDESADCEGALPCIAGHCCESGLCTIETPAHSPTSPTAASPTPTPTPTSAVSSVLSLVQVLRGNENFEFRGFLGQPTVGHDGRRVYVACTSGIRVFERAEDTSALILIDEMSFPEFPKPPNGKVAVPSPDRRHVYLLGSCCPTTVLQWDDATAMLELIAQQIDGPSFGGHDGVVTADGRVLYTTGGSKVSVFRSDADTGLLEPVQRFTLAMPGGGLANGRGIALSPDERNVYVAGWGDNRVSVYSRDLHSGRLEFVEEHIDEIVDSALFRVQSVAVAPDGEHVYAASAVTSSVLVFKRDADGNGTLRLMGVVKEERASWVQVAPDGRHVFVASREGVGRGGVSVFTRSASGDLTFVGFHAVAGTGLFVAIAPDGSSLYLSGPGVLAAFDVITNSEELP